MTRQFMLKAINGNRLSGYKEEDGWKTGIGFQCVRNGELCRPSQQLLWDDAKDCDQGEDLCYDWSETSTSGTYGILK